jgi:hypothetical protein
MEFPIRIRVSWVEQHAAGFSSRDAANAPPQVSKSQV